MKEGDGLDADLKQGIGAWEYPPEDVSEVLKQGRMHGARAAHAHIAQGIRPGADLEFAVH